jgi:uncharacterized Fe-S cluster protein YjdI/CDGSH-type Zn-finger protein
VADKLHIYTGEAITVTFDSRKCIHAAECTRGLPAVFDIQKRPWVQPQHAPAAVVAEIVERCPSGALQYTRHDGAPNETIPAVTMVRPQPNGPLYVRGPLRIVNEQGEVVYEGARAALCRCGASGNKPFCDNSHLRLHDSAASGAEA